MSTGDVSAASSTPHRDGHGRSLKSGSTDDLDRRRRTGLSKPGSHVTVVRIDLISPETWCPPPRTVVPRAEDCFTGNPVCSRSRLTVSVRQSNDPTTRGTQSRGPIHPRRRRLCTPLTSVPPSPPDTGTLVAPVSTKYETEPARTSFTGNPVCLRPSAAHIPSTVLSPVDRNSIQDHRSASVSDGIYRSTTPSAVTTVDALGSSSSVSSTTSTAHSSLTDAIPSKTCSGTSGIGTGTYAFARMAATPS